VRGDRASLRSQTNSQENNDLLSEQQIHKILKKQQSNITNILNSQDESQSQSYKGHSNNSPDDLSIINSSKKLPKQLKWILV